MFEKNKNENEEKSNDNTNISVFLKVYILYNMSGSDVKLYQCSFIEHSAFLCI